MSEEKQKRVPSSGILIIEDTKEGDFDYQIFDKEGIIYESCECFSTMKECREHITRLKKVFKNRFMSIKVAEEKSQ